jgi:putative component of toxin-antitoxin plasmid stabilization module
MWLILLPKTWNGTVRLALTIDKRDAFCSLDQRVNQLNSAKRKGDKKPQARCIWEIREEGGE